MVSTINTIVIYKIKLKIITNVSQLRVLFKILLDVI